MKKYIILLLFICIAQINKAQSPFVNSWFYGVLLPDSAIDGNGFIRFVINENQLEIQISAVFAETPLKVGKIIDLPGGNTLPDMYLGEVTGGYTSYIKSGAFYIDSKTTPEISSIGKFFRVDLNHIQRLESSIKLTREQNYIYTVTPTEAQTDISNVKKALRDVTYFDGLGRLDQSIQIGATPNGFDIVQPVYYDNLGREQKKYLPYASASSILGSYVTSEFQESNWQEHYGNTEKDYAYSRIKYDGSPLNRVVEQGAPGKDWQPKSGDNDFSGHTIKIEYSANIAKEVLCFEVENDNWKQVECYAANQLYKTTTKDENWTSEKDKLHTTEEFKDKLGQVVLKRSYVGNASSPTKVDTYYVYDDYGLLRYVIPPKAVEVYLAGGSTTSNVSSGYQVVSSAKTLSSPESGVSKYFVKRGASLTLIPGFHFKATASNSLQIESEQINWNEFNELIYAYKYDARKRMIEKKLPGAKLVYMVYDDRDRLVATQDGNQRENEKWLITKYDELNRPIITALYHSTNTYDEMVNEVFEHLDEGRPLYETRGASLRSYTNVSFPCELEDHEIVTVNYYDNYLNISSCPKDRYDQSFIQNSNVFDQPKGQVTASWVKSINADTGKNSGLWTVNFYDKKYRVVQTYAENYLGGYDYTTNTYDFVGKVDRTIHKHTTGTTNITESKWFTYDHVGRMLKIEQQYTGSVNKARVTIAEMEYDELGQLVRKNLPLVDRNLDYAYNIRGWMTQMNAAKTGSNSDFGFNLKYQTDATTFGGENQFNGNIGAMEWWCSNLGDKNHHQAYGYQYDALNRITKADYKAYNSGWKDDSGYDVTGLTYDLNGNIKSLNRYGNGKQIDQLSYGYNGNQLTYVNDGIDDLHGFKESSNSTLEYDYDSNGNMIKDDNKDIDEIHYNLLNLPKTIVKSDKSIDYAYSATGEKLENRVSTSKKLQYCANFVYENGSLRYILNEEGKLDVGTTSNYQFFIKDHLGNTRVVLAEGGSTVTEVNHYYPFGMRMDMAALPKDPYQKYLYNGKELQDETDWLDYGARFYDPALGRWHVPDPLTEKYESWSTYQYVRNNPILRIDPNGMDDYKVNRETGAMELVKKTDDKTDRILETYSRKSRRGEVKYKKNGKAKVAFGGVEKGILKDGINFQKDDNIIEVGGEKQASVEGVKSFTLKLSEYVGKEIKGFSYSANNSGDVTDVLLGAFKGNTLTTSKCSPAQLLRKYGISNTLNNIVEQFHTHPNGKIGATQSAPGLSTDVTNLQKDKPTIPNASFIILYRILEQVKPGEYDYTHEYRPQKK